MFIDYRKLNRITIWNKYPLPQIDDLFDKLQGASVFTNIDRRFSYHLLNIRPEHVPKTTFRNQYRYYEFSVMSFRFKNAPTTFMSFMNDVFKPFLYSFVIIFIDYILVNSKRKEEHAYNLLLFWVFFWNKSYMPIFPSVNSSLIHLPFRTCSFKVRDSVRSPKN